MPSANSTTTRVRPVSGGMVWPQVPSNDTSGICRLPQANMPRYHGGAPGISDGVLEADDFGHAGTRDDQAPVEQRDQQAVDFGYALGHVIS